MACGILPQYDIVPAHFDADEILVELVVLSHAIHEGESHPVNEVGAEGVSVNCAYARRGRVVADKVELFDN